MSREDVERKVREVLEAVLARKIARDERVERAQEPGWDSLAHVNIVFSVESELGIEFSAEEIERLDSVEALVRLSESHLRASA